MSEFRTVLVEGLFYEREGHFFVEDENGRHGDVDALLTPFADDEVLFVLHHLPPAGGIGTGQGGGSCRWPDGRGCPAGHETRPERLLAFHETGILRKDPWRVETGNRVSVSVPLRGMAGHTGRLSVVSVGMLPE